MSRAKRNPTSENEVDLHFYYAEVPASAIHTMKQQGHKPLLSKIFLVGIKPAVCAGETNVSVVGWFNN